MYCKYCGKELSEGGRFCAYCGKNQDECNTENKITSESNYNRTDSIPEFEVPNAKFFSIISLVIEVGIIALSFTPMVSMSVGNDYIGYSQSYNVFDLFKKSDIFDHIAILLNSEYNRNSRDSIYGLNIFFGVILCVLIAWCILYFLYNISTYTIKSGKNNKIHFGFVYSVYSSVPSVVLSIGIIILNIVYSSWFGSYVSVSFSPTSIIVCILSVVQFMVNRIYLSE